MHPQALRPQTADGGFWVVHDDPNSLLVLPSGYITVMAGHFSTEKDAKGSWGMRWSVLDSSSKAASTRALEQVRGIINMYPEVRDGEYALWAKCLDSYLLPAAA